MNILDNLFNDPQVELPVLKRSAGFCELVRQLPQALDELLFEPLTINTLMEARHKTLLYLAEKLPRYRDKLLRLAQAESQYEVAELILQTVGETEREYCMRRPGLTEAEYDKMQRGELIVYDILMERPAVILAPVLRTKRTMN